jgi:cell division protein FtsI/penicillin-binding protein 2
MIVTPVFPSELGLILDKKCQELGGKYKKFAVIVSQITQGKIIYHYNKTMLYDEKYSPGSLLKPFTLIASAKKNSLKIEENYDCQGFKKYSREKICWYGPGHGLINLARAFAYSCNAYFYDRIIKDKLDYSDFLSTVADFGIETGISATAMNKEDFYRSAVGLDYAIALKPVQIYLAYQALLNGGNLFSAGNTFLRPVKVSEELVEIIKEGLRGAYIYGTAKLVFQKTKIKNILAKTGTGAGTSKNKPDWRKTSGWIVLFYPAHKPKIGIMVLCDKANGSKEASEIAADLLPLVYTMQNH